MSQVSKITIKIKNLILIEKIRHAGVKRNTLYKYTIRNTLYECTIQKLIPIHFSVRDDS